MGPQSEATYGPQESHQEEGKGSTHVVGLHGALLFSDRQLTAGSLQVCSRNVQSAEVERLNGVYNKLLRSAGVDLIGAVAIPAVA